MSQRQRIANAAFARAAGEERVPRRADQHLGGNVEPVVRAADHGDGRAALAVQHFRDAGARADERLKGLGRSAPAAPCGSGSPRWDRAGPLDGAGPHTRR
jgi:hypothetical protein